jgi:CheY-like chemotaxis protein
VSEARILIVDDDAAMLRSTERVLSSKHEVFAVRRPAEALLVAPDFEPDLAVLDIRMSDMDGFELANRLRAVVPGVDVIFMTGIVHELDAQLIRSIREKAFYFIQKPFDRDVLITLVERCLELRWLAAENRAHTQRLEEELEEARQFQHGLMPEGIKRIHDVTISARYEPCAAMGGDFYDWVDAGGRQVAFMQADVSGHGVSAAMLVGIVKAAFRATRVDRFDPLAVVHRIANAILPFDHGRFVTLFAGRADPTHHSLEYVTAGHPRPLLRRATGSLEELLLTGPLVSPALPDLAWEKAQISFGMGDQLLVYTDGIIEARSEDEQFGRQRLADVVRDGPADGADLLGAVLAAVDGWRGGRPADDDETLLAVSPGP